ncbi:MAG: hypothetical protein GX230_06885 [Lentisphaerae bacterium]|jgi:hypothetical protein|nr:hypothetical protein [Lentisphaerota bacterium]
MDLQLRVNERVVDRDFKYYIFDWDDNILMMPTRIHLEKLQPDGSWAPHAVSTALFAVIRRDTVNYRPPQNNWELAFREFRDRGECPAEAFLQDTRTAINAVLEGEVPPAPSFETFRRTLTEGRLFAIVTARGHASDTLRKGVQLFMEMVLTVAEREEMMANLRGYRYAYDGLHNFGSDDEEIDYYLSLNRYHAVTSPTFKEWMADGSPGGVVGSSEERKQFAIRDFVEHIVHILQRTGEPLRRPVSVGFSDDDPANVVAVEEYIRTTLSRHFPGVKFVVYDTSDPDTAKGRKIVVSGQLNLF